MKLPAFLTLVLLAASPSHAADVPRIFFDTDMATDCDDAGALAVLHMLADQGECEILATVSSSLNPTGCAAVDAINRYYRRPDLLVGTVKGPGVNEKSRFTQRLAAEFLHRFGEGVEIPDALTIYRDVLEKQPDHSVTIVTVGYLTNLRNLMRLPASGARVSGMDLIRAKVKKWVCMGGNFIGSPPADDLKLDNVNFRRDAAAAYEVIRQWPVRLEFAGREVCSLPSGLKAGAVLVNTPENNPVRRAYEVYLGGPGRSRHVADLVAVLYAVRGLRDYWNLSESGWIDIAPDCAFAWKADPMKQQAYLIKKQVNGQPNDRYVEKTLDDLLLVSPK
ncbi:MAG: nucleoside hydrolase [Verrucomicrobiaceae bacterium]|nr:nucleoside hydrolase [Verrucomicrobiaceae bacterium]